MAKKLQKVDSLQTDKNTSLTGEQLWKKVKTKEEFENLSTQDQDLMEGYFTGRIKEVFDAKDKKDLDGLLYKAEKFFSKETYMHHRNQTFIINQLLIEQAITDIVKESHTMPPAMAIADRTGLSRYTVSKHLKQYANHPLIVEQQEIYKIMAVKLLGVLSKLALKGDTRAAKIYLDNIFPKPTGTSFVKNQQNNFIINGVELTEERLKSLPKESLEQISQIIKQAQPIPIQEG